MRRTTPFLLLVALLVISPATAGVAASPAHTRTQAEVNVLRTVPRKWTARQIPGLVNRRTHLLANNTEAVCSGRGPRRPGKRYSRFICVVRPKMHTSRQGLFVSYRALPRGRFVLRWISYRRR
jgi:hypothetical protein